ncbi:hypothetical protein PPTG_20460 [Phytophthora nicotianae INRA-310]|uniref:Uncharacterized protein n=2 Tax=Phytophthora nicotianae TaxID=4792 RepID=W2PAC0_PHYN3|nr:hypothetical protein PPTG_20460 [Phytophthora nicotianae INRA-310]ETI35224.1 hypothetical protein F443_18387 [Phytophthora nicotianae P1569]ETM97188.1 hypothetical protein PPTG_20460 [Phytophthora nicotianae INRA-310]
MKRSLRSNSRSDGNEETAHTLTAFRDLPQYAEARTTGKRVQRQCSRCHKKCSYYCAGCSDIPLQPFVGVCGQDPNARASVNM